MGFPRKDTGVGCHFLLQGTFQTHGLNPCLPHCRQILITECPRDMYDDCIIAANDSISFFFYGWIICHCLYICIYISTYITSSLFIHVNGHLGCFYILVLVSSAAIDIGKQTSFWIRILYWDYAFKGELRVGFHSLRTTDIWGWITLCYWGASMYILWILETPSFLHSGDDSGILPHC